MDHRTSPRPGGRSARVVDAVHRAATELVAEATADEAPADEGPVTVPTIAARAGVNATTIYRRWGDVDTLLVEVAMAVLNEDTAVPDTGSLERDLQVWTEFLVTDISRPERKAFLRRVVGSLTEDRSGCLDKRRSQIEDILARAVDRGDVNVPTDRDALDQLLAPLYFRILFGLGGAEKSDARRLVRRLVGRD